MTSKIGYDAEDRTKNRGSKPRKIGHADRVVQNQKHGEFEAQDTGPILTFFIL